MIVEGKSIEWLGNVWGFIMIEIGLFFVRDESFKI